MKGRGTFGGRKPWASLGLEIPPQSQEQKQRAAWTQHGESERSRALCLLRRIPMWGCLALD